MPIFLLGVSAYFCDAGSWSGLRSTTRRRSFFVRSPRCGFALRKGQDRGQLLLLFLLFNRRVRALCGALFWFFLFCAPQELNRGQLLLYVHLIIRCSSCPLRSALFSELSIPQILLFEKKNIIFSTWTCFFVFSISIIDRRICGLRLLSFLSARCESLNIDTLTCITARGVRIWCTPPFFLPAVDCLV